MSINEVLLVAGMAIVTFAVRYPVLTLISKVTLPPSLLSALRFIPPAVLTAIIIPALIAPTGEMDISLTNVYFVPGLITTFVATRTRNLLLILAIGMAAFWGWRFLIAWVPFL